MKSPVLGGDGSGPPAACEAKAVMMYRNTLLTALLIVAIVIAIELRPNPVATRMEPVIPEPAQCLQRRIPTLTLRHTKVRDALEQMHKITGVEFSVDWLSIPAWDLEELNLELHDVTVNDALAQIFRINSSHSNVPLEQVDFDVVSGCVRIADASRFPAAVMTLRIYDVRDLLTDQYWGCASGPNPAEAQADRNARLCGIIESFSGSRDWEAQRQITRFHVPRGEASITFLAGRILVRQTNQGHRQVEAALERLRNGGIQPGQRKG